MHRRHEDCLAVLQLTGNERNSSMPHVDLELNPVDFITVGTVGPKGRRLFHLQAGRGAQVVSLTIEKEQARALTEALVEMLDDLAKHNELDLPPDTIEMTGLNMDLREPIEPQFRVAQMGLGYDKERDLVVLVAQEMIALEEGQEPETLDLAAVQPSVVRLWATRRQMRALSLHAQQVVKQGRVDPQSNGRLLYYWT
jgi:uncharacterized repeat protein (TIGR03847 family)